MMDSCYGGDHNENDDGRLEQRAYDVKVDLQEINGTLCYHSLPIFTDSINKDKTEMDLLSKSYPSKAL